jgi:hypothetical protein
MAPCMLPTNSKATDRLGFALPSPSSPDTRHSLHEKIWTLTNNVDTSTTKIREAE